MVVQKMAPKNFRAKTIEVCQTHQPYCHWKWHDQKSHPDLVLGKGIKGGDE
jgi:hypothetical protein